MTKVKWSGSILWLCTTISFGCIGPFPDGPDESAGDEGASEPESGGTADASGITQPTEAEPDSMGTTDPWPTTDPTATASATSISGTATCAECGESTGGGYPDDPPQVCGVEIEHDPTWNNTYFCGCEACNVEFNNITPESGGALLAECECICYEVGCGGTVTAGATSEEPDEGGSQDSGGTAGETGVDTYATSPTGGSDESGSDSRDATG